MIAIGSYDPKAFRGTGERPYPFLGPENFLGSQWQKQFLRPG